MPGTLMGKYQDNTQANVARLREAGYNKQFITLEEGIRDYVDWLGSYIRANPTHSNPGLSNS